ncbi:NACHT and WD repeat domain-containing protein 2-like [Argopecten irradians]|uniref:NACHT and WD repeat domain-containing protein 2-like n=1 Tax=Argopecten irradians TaxID=31199 RepID=UPI00371B9D2A
MEGGNPPDGAAPEPGGQNGELPPEEQEKLQRVLSGCLGNLPALSSKIVRIFTSSTFTDTTIERNALMENVYPKLKEYLRERYGLEFQVVDMRWGVRDEATDDHMTTQLCMQEIDNCQRLSIGPNFVVFLGQKYGYRPLPTFIVATEFEMIRECVKSVKDEIEVLDKWYMKDENTVPAVYVLQPISSILTNFNNKRHQRLQEQDQNTWWETFLKLQRIMRKAAQVLFITKKLDREQMHNYFMSVTEREVERGILKANNVQDHCLAYVREIANINPTMYRFAYKFVDFAARNIDGEAQKLLQVLRDEKLTKKMPESNLVRFKVEWGREGIDKDTHKDYLENFTNHFHTSIAMLVDNAMAKHERLSSDPVFTEALQHLHACTKYCKVFQGREDIVKKIEEHIVGPSNRPFVLHGESGCGKTSLTAKGASQIKSWFPEDRQPMLVIRFLGTTPNSSSIIPLLTSLCKQICVLYDSPSDDIPDELAPLIHHFKTLLNLATEEKPLVLILDSLDQLSGSDGAHQLAWLPSQLPANVKMILSTLPRLYGILDTIRIMIEPEENYVAVLPLGENLSGTILKFWLKNANKAITDAQWDLVNEAFTKCNLPLFVKLVFDQICTWKSYTKPSTTVLQFTIHDSIMKLYERIEIQHGKTLVAHAFGYITAAKSGVSESELEDLLSLDEKVLNDVYQYHLPPVRRIPPLLWTRIRSDLPGYLSEREADGVNVVGWYHRQFIEAARERYFRNLNFVSVVHANLSEYFLGIWGGGVPKPFEYTEGQRRMFKLDEMKGESDRKVPIQRLVFSSDGAVTRYNLRKLSELPYHLIRSHQYEDLYATVLFNYKWLHAKLSSMPLQSVLADFEDLLEHVYQKDVKLIADAIRLSSSILSHYPDMLGPQIIGRLLPYYQQNTNIRSLIQQCDSDGLEDCALVPAHHCLHTPGGPLQYSLEGHPFAPFGIGTTSNGRYLVSVSNKFIIWDLSNGEVFRNVVPGINGIMSNLSICENDKYAASFTNNNQVVICTIMTGDYRIITPVMNGKTASIIGTFISNSHVAIWTSLEWYLYSTNGDLISRHDTPLKMPLLAVDLGNDDKTYLICKSGTENDTEMALEVQDQSIEPFEFHSGIAVNKEKNILYTCIEISDNAVAVYKREDSVWRYDRTLGDNFDIVFALTLSEDENYLVATIALGYKLWNLKTDALVQLKLPPGTRNIPTKNQLSTLVVFTKHNHFVVAGVRKNMYVWDTKQGNMVKVLDAHFGRIISLRAVSSGCNKVISSSIDKTIKVWNFDNILEDVHSIDRMEKPIETIDLASETHYGVTTSRNCVGVWNLGTGKLELSLETKSVVSLAVITKDGKYVAAAETGKLLIWEVSQESASKVIQHKDIQQLLLNEGDTRVITLAKEGFNKGKVVTYTFPEGEPVYTFEYNLRVMKPGVLTIDGSFFAVLATDKTGDVLGVYHAKSGTHLYNLGLKYNNYKPVQSMRAMRHDPHQVVLVDEEKGNVIDLKKKTVPRSVSRWNGMVMKNGKFGLYAPNRGGLQLLELKTGKTVRTFIPRVAEGVFSIDVMFTQNDRHVVYYHSGHRTIRVFRVSDGKMVANFKAHAEVKAMVSTAEGETVVIGAVDGSFTVLSIADPEYEESVEFLQCLPSRNIQTNTPNGYRTMNGDIVQSKNSMGTALQVARFVAKARQAQKSRACVIS